MAVRDEIGLTKTAFVFAGGGSFGAIQVGMLHSLASHGITADMVVGSSVGALNGAFYAGDPTLKGVERLGTIWRGLTRQDVFPMSWRTVLSFLWRRDFLIPHDGIRKLIEDHIPYRNLQDAKLPLHIVTTDIVTGDSVVLSEGPIDEAIVASTAIPGAFAPVHYRNYYLADGAISSNTPIQVAVKKGARRLIILPTGHACATQTPPVGAVANALHALTLLIARQLVSELESLGPEIEYFVVPPLCPLVGSPYDFSRTADHIARAIETTDAWLAQHSLQEGRIPDEMRPHSH
ncbi:MULTISPECIES: patatin-like phospholipase family protein [Bradyrhizobium]|uniref:NTE family protein n=2 Tax=Bradyrhizobium TaxID=374 RepID=A0ABY0PVS7_9BRAD|nr:MULTISPECIES: patatin-like phospholipase family protein [Bradyrhizobium]SDI93960.1 NTE family protein [Bradyrhizobium ottawaense]SED07006.1 NTE family protein [Bradyrhizobium lablabi]SHL13537.1 NTE family protein [Bradyrhizobium lablabi]